MESTKTDPGSYDTYV